MDLVDEREFDAHFDQQVADGVGDGGLGLLPDDGQAKEPGELDGEHLRGGPGRDGDVHDRQSSCRGRAESFTDQEFIVAAELGDGSRLPGPGLAGDNQPAAGDLIERQERRRLGQPGDPVFLAVDPPAAVWPDGGPGG